LVTHPEIVPGQTRLTPEFFAGGLPEKKLQLGSISMLLILLNRGVLQLRVKASRVRIFQSDLKTAGGVTAGGARGTIAEVMSESNQRRMGQCDELRRTLLPLLYRYRFIRP
jgi:hypothetical protein